MTMDRFYDIIDVFSQHTGIVVKIGAKSDRPDRENAAAHVIMYNPEKLDQINIDGIIDCDPSLEQAPMILVNRWFLNERLDQLEDEHLLNLLLHEYGHILTMDQDTEDVHIESWFKSFIIDNMFVMFSNDESGFFASLFLTIYHHLPVEKAANEAGCVDVGVLLDVDELVYIDISSPECYPYRNLIDFHFTGDDKELLHRVYEMYFDGVSKGSLSDEFRKDFRYLKEKLCKEFLPEKYLQYV